MVDVGQGLLLKLNFADGGECRSPRTFLVVEKNSTEIKLLNISSVQGKERKLAMPCNKRVRLYNPPFRKDSFVKLDALYIVPNNCCLKETLLCSGRRMHQRELDAINIARQDFKNNIGNILERTFNLDEVISLNENINILQTKAT